MPLFIEKPYLKEEPPGSKQGLQATEMPDFLVSNASMNANGNSPPWVCSSALSEPQLFIMSENFHGNKKGISMRQKECMHISA